MGKSGLLIFILAGGVFSILNTEMGVIGLLPAVSAYYNIDIVRAGLLVSMFALGVAIAGPTMPLLCSRFRRKPIMLLVLGVFTACNIVAVFASSFEILLLARVIPAFFHPVYCAMAFSMAAASVAAENVPKAIARINMGVAAGMVIGVPVSNFLAGQFGFREAMSFFAVVTGIMFVATLLFVPDKFAGEQKSYGEQFSVLRRGQVWLAVIAVVFLNGSIFGVYNYMAEYLERVAGVANETGAFLLLVFGVMNVAGSWLAGSLLSRQAGKTIMAFPIAVALLYSLLYSYAAYGLAVIAACIVMWGILGGINANINQYLVAKVTKDAPDFGNGLFLTAANIGCVVGTFIGGIFIQSIGLYAVFLAGIVMVVPALLILYIRRSAAGEKITGFSCCK